MVGGWGGESGGFPLGTRPRPGAGALPAPCPSRHCWVTDAVDGRGVQRPGLLVEWRRAGPSWMGRVIYVALRSPEPGAEAWMVVEEWLPAERLRPLVVPTGPVSRA